MWQFGILAEVETQTGGIIVLCMTPFCCVFTYFLSDRRAPIFIEISIDCLPLLQIRPSTKLYAVYCGINKECRPIAQRVFIFSRFVVIFTYERTVIVVMNLQFVGYNIVFPQESSCLQDLGCEPDKYHFNTFVCHQTLRLPV